MAIMWWTALSKVWLTLTIFAGPLSTSSLHKHFIAGVLVWLILNCTEMLEEFQTSELCYSQ